MVQWRQWKISTSSMQKTNSWHQCKIIPTNMHLIHINIWLLVLPIKIGKIVSYAKHKSIYNPVLTTIAIMYLQPEALRTSTSIWDHAFQGSGAQLKAVMWKKTLLILPLVAVDQNIFSWLVQSKTKVFHL